MPTYQPAELEAALRKAFVEHKATTIRFDSRRQVFTIACVDYGLEKGLLEHTATFDEDDILGAGLGQSRAYFYSLTKEGKKYFGIAEE